MSEPLRVGICGFGVAGGALAILLARAGHRLPFAVLSRLLSPFFQSNSTVLALGRDIALPLMCAIPWVRRQMELSAAGLKQGFLDRL
jgi:hypothetical protein